MHPIHSARATHVVALLAAFLPSSLVAQRADSASASRVPDIVVTATRVPFAAVTSATTVLQGEQLRREGITTLADALRTVPGLALVQTSSPGTRTSIYTRGGESGYTRVLVDGVPVNDPGGEFDYAHLTTDNIDRIEIIRGPSSVLYGTDAVSGVIQVFTRDGARTPGATVEVRAGSFAARALSGALSGAADGVSYSIGMTRTATDGIHPFNSGYDRTALSSAVRVGRTGRGDARLAVHYADATTHVPTDGAGRLVDRNAFQFGERLTIGLDAGVPVSSRVEFRMLLAAHTTDGGFDDAADGVMDTLGFYASTGLDHVSRRSIDVRANASLSDHVMLTGGGALEEQQQRGFTNYESEWGPSRSDVDVERSTRAGYVQLLGVTGPARWNLGARLDDSDAFGTFRTWRAGIALDVTRSLRVRAVAGRAFREPTFFQNFAQGFVLGNPDLRPEQSRSWEVGADHRVGDHVRLGATWFHQHFTDLIEYSYSSTPGTPNYFNVAGARARGLELEGELRFDQVRIDAGYTLLDGEITEAGFDQSGTGFFVDGAALLRRPARSASVRLSWQPRAGREVGVRAVHSGRRDDLDYASGGRAELAAYTVVDVTAHVRAVRGAAGRPGIGVTARVSNLFDAQYQAVLGFGTPGRALEVSLRVE